jgi:glycosyltransferase 2 family protein
LKKRVFGILKVLVFLCIGLFFLWLIYRDTQWSDIVSILQNDVNYYWILLSLIIGLISHISRAMRWQLLIEPTGSKTGTTNTFMAVMVGYFANLAIPRMGEVVRCGVLSKYEKVSFATLVGTVVFERVFDLILLLIITFIAITTQYPAFMLFLNAHPEFLENLQSIFTLKGMAIAFGILIIIAFIMHLFMRKIKGYNRIKHILHNLWTGIISVVRMKRKWEFLAHSVFIWLCYYLMCYFCFFAFDFTAHFMPLPALLVFVMGSYGMLAPVPGGIGPWHFMTIAALQLYGVELTPAGTFAFVAHASMTLLVIVAGFLSLLLLPIVNSKKH